MEQTGVIMTYQYESVRISTNHSNGHWRPLAVIYSRFSFVMDKSVR